MRWRGVELLRDIIERVGHMGGFKKFLLRGNLWT